MSYDSQRALELLRIGSGQMDAKFRKGQEEAIRHVVEGRSRLLERLDDLQAHRLYPDEVRYYEQLYGAAAMREKRSLFVSTDGCHPNRAGMSILADGLATAVLQSRGAGTLRN